LTSCGRGTADLALLWRGRKGWERSERKGRGKPGEKRNPQEGLRGGENVGGGEYRLLDLRKIAHGTLRRGKGGKRPSRYGRGIRNL